MQIIKVVSTVDFEKTKRKARNLKRATGISHSEALEQVAREAGFDNWHQVTLANGRMKPSEVAFRSGCVLVFDTRDGMDLDTSDGTFIEDLLLSHICRAAVYQLVINSPDEEDPTGRPIKETLPPSELEQWFEDVMEDSIFFRLREDLADRDESTVMAMLQERSFWLPRYMWFRGHEVDPHELSSRAGGDQST